MDQAEQIVDSWMPKLSPKQQQVFDCYKRYILCCGGRRNGKSVVCAHKVFRHMVETPGARVALIATTIKSAKEGGAFADITEIVYPMWYDANIWGAGGRIEYTSVGSNGLPGPKMDAATRTSSFRIRNIYGGESELQLFSIDNENQVEAITKSKRYTMVWLSEGSNFKSDKVFKNIIQMLRTMHIPDEAHQLIVDTNPAEEGDEHWIYQKWFVERLMDQPPKAMRKTNDNPNGMTQAEWEVYRQDFEVFEFQLEDNPFLTPREIAELKASNCDNQGDYDRNILGKWVKGFGLRGKVFADLVQPIHFIPNMIDVDEATIELVGGWDMGRVNHAGVIVEPRLVSIPASDGRQIEMMHYMVLDEVVITDERVSTEEFAIMMWDKIRALEHFYQRNYRWVHWSDNSAWNYNASSGDIDATIVLHATQGMVELQPANKANQSVEAGIKFMRRLLFDNRLFVGENCPKTQEMLRLITEKDIEEDTYLKHPFDALRYVIYMQERNRYFETAMPRSTNRSFTVHA